MCGICGYYGEDERLNPETLRVMNELITHRGPDEDGFFESQGVGLAMRRLSILDLAHGKQPVFNETGTVCTVFNGEIYNYREIKQCLEAEGHRFRTSSDTEVIVHLYEKYGQNLVHHLRGMFAFALWDIKNRRLLIARDRVGIKPLFYSIAGDKLVFGSEMKCVLASGMVSRNIDYQALDAYLTYTYVPAPLTIYQDIRKLEPGHMMVVDRSGIRIEQYWDLDFSELDEEKSEVEWKSIFDEAIYDAVKSHLVSDVPVGAFLSGGVDSSLIVAMMSDATAHAVETFTMGFEEKSGSLLDERVYARLLSEQYRLEYNEFTVTPHFTDIIEDVVTAFDEPFADDSVVPSYYISQLTSNKVKVALSGLGGDELFAGYHRYSGLYLSRLYDYVPAYLRQHLVMPLVNRLPEPRNASDRVNHLKRFVRYSDMPPAQRYLGYVSTLDVDERRALLGQDLGAEIDFDATGRIVLDRFDTCKGGDMIDRMLYTDIKTYLPDDILALSDRMSMWHSLELRVPFVDHKLVEISARLPSRYKINLFSKKRLLKKIARKWVPDRIIDHRKQGFESPMAGWLKNELREFTDDCLSDESLQRIGIFNRNYIREKLEAHHSGRERNNKIIFSLLMFVLWYRQHVA